MQDMILYFHLCIICVFLYSINAMSNGSKNKHLKEHITDIYSSSDSWLFSILLGEQAKLDIEPKYKIEYSEKEEVIYLIQLYRKDMTDSFLRNELYNGKELVELQNSEYYCATLCEYLHSGIFIKKYNAKKHNVFGKLISYEKFENDGSIRTFFMSDFGKTYYKLEYVCNYICAQNKMITKYLKEYECRNNMNVLKKMIDKNTCGISIYRP